MIKGIDVSKWQGSIEWHRVKADDHNIKFAIVKAGGSDKGFYKDETFERNYKGAKDVGLDVGCYYIVGNKFISKNDGIADAERFYNIIKGKKFDFPVYLDLEKTLPKDKAGATEASIAFCDYMESKGYYVAIYASDISGFKEKLDTPKLNAYDKWVANYIEKPTYVKTYGIWQYSSKGAIKGIIGNVDMDECYKDYPHIMAVNGLNGYSKTKPTPKPQPKPTPKPKNDIYIVKKNDNLTKIAKAKKVKLKDLIKANPQIKDINVIHVGDKIKIPR